jgi:cbb3-type cytochrome oxidase subunit 3
MFSFLLKSATYLILWRKFQKQIILVVLSLIVISIISSVYEDLYKVLKVSNKDALIGLLLFKWFLISSIIIYNIYKLKQVHIEDSEKKAIFENDDKVQKVYPKKSQDVLKKDTLQTTTDLILKKYINDK